MENSNELEELDNILKLLDGEMAQLTTIEENLESSSAKPRNGLKSNFPPKFNTNHEPKPLIASNSKALKSSPPIPPSKNLKPKSMPPLPPGKDLKPKPPPKPKRKSVPQSPSKV